MAKVIFGHGALCGAKRVVYDESGDDKPHFKIVVDLGQGEEIEGLLDVDVEDLEFLLSVRGLVVARLLAGLVAAVTRAEWDELSDGNQTVWFRKGV